MNLQELAELAVATGDGNALASVTRERWVMLRFARSRPTQATSVDDVTVQLAVTRAGHVGRASTNRTDSDSLRECSKRAVRRAEMAAKASGPGAFPGFGDPAEPQPHEGYDRATAVADTATGGAVLRTAFETAEAAGVQVGGIWTTGEVESAVASSSGASALDRVTDAYMKVVAFAGPKRSGYASTTAVSASAIDARALTAQAAEKATAGGEQLVLDPGEYTVLFERHAVSELLWVLSRVAFNGLVHLEGRGALSGKLRTRVAAPAINIADSPRYPGTLPRAFDAEGVAKRALPLIEDGVAHAVAHDTRSAAIAATHSTGHALEAGGAARGPIPTNLLLLGDGEADEATLCAGVECGIYVTRLWYTNPVRTHDSLFTAVTRDGTFLIEDGRVTSPVADMRVTDSALGVLARTRALGARPELTSDGEFYGRRFATGSVCPALLADGVNVTGSAGA